MRSQKNRVVGVSGSGGLLFRHSRCLINHTEAELPIWQGGAAAPPTAGGSPYYPSLLPQARQSSGVVAWSTAAAFNLGRRD
jgi:hypothetical protein